MKSRPPRLQCCALFSFFALILVAQLFPLSPPERRAQLSSQEKSESKRRLEIADLMKFNAIRQSRISADGRWLGCVIKPDRGDGRVVIYNLSAASAPPLEMPRGVSPVFSQDGGRCASLISPSFLEVEKNNQTTKKNKKELRTGLMMINLQSGDTVDKPQVKLFAFTRDSRWLIYQTFPQKEEREAPSEYIEDGAGGGDADFHFSGAPESGDADKKTTGETDAGDKDKTADKWVERSFNLILVSLADGKEIVQSGVINYALDPSSRYLAYSVYDPEKKKNGIFVRELDQADAAEYKIHSEPAAVYTNLKWSKTRSRLGFIYHRNVQEEEKGMEGEGLIPFSHENRRYVKRPLLALQRRHQATFSSGLVIWDGENRWRITAVPRARIPAGWILPADNNLQWTDDGERLFFGFKPYKEYLHTLAEVPEKKEENDDILALAPILEKRKLEVWHWKDAKIVPQQKSDWEKLRKRLYTAVYHVKKDEVFMLADLAVSHIETPRNPQAALGFAEAPYLRESTWTERYMDVYICYLNNGFRRKLITRLNFRHPVTLSPQGKYVAWYQDRFWYVHDVEKKTTRRLTDGIATPFHDDEYDYPGDAPGYGFAGWTQDDRSILVYDRYDIWEFSTGAPGVRNLTAAFGREHKMRFRVLTLSEEQFFFSNNQPLLLTAFSETRKFNAFYSAQFNQVGVKRLLEEDKYFVFLGKAEKADQVIYTRESYEEFPDIWVADMTFSAPRRITGANPQMKEFLWGKAELVQWRGLDGKPLDGVLIKPDNYDPSRRYPVIMYFYETMSDRLHRFSSMSVNHRPCFPYYVGDDYVMFLPDVRFEVGDPGGSSYKCIVSGAQELIDRGVADAKAIGIHGHSWGGYQTAFLVTQTDMFAAAAAGAPVGNMVSAYGGIRWSSGQARLFQYEQGQSRIGKSLAESPDLYIKNSPIFLADRINTPLLMQFGDRDGAVPWYQGIELYLSMRRLDKNCILLVYNDEPHHLQQYPNRVDYALKLKEFFDHYLKHAPAQEWLKGGELYKKPLQ